MKKCNRFRTKIIFSNLMVNLFTKLWFNNSLVFDTPVLEFECWSSLVKVRIPIEELMWGTSKTNVGWIASWRLGALGTRVFDNFTTWRIFLFYCCVIFPISNVTVGLCSPGFRVEFPSLFRLPFEKMKLGWHYIIY